MTTSRSGQSGKAQGTPTVSFAGPDGLLIELLHDPEQRTTALAVGRPGEPPHVEPFVDLPTGERLVPYSATNNLIATGCVLLPSDVAEFGDKAALLAEVEAFLHRYVDLTPDFEQVAAHYVLLTWAYDAFNELPYLRFRGDYGTGKTRALLAVGSLCNKPFFASGASTVSPIFHVLNAFSPTLVLDEADFRYSDATAELTKVLNNGNVRGLPVLRTMTNRHRELNPEAFRVFGPKIIGMREHFSDRALESRFLTEETGGRALRPEIPIHLPDALALEARALRNKLLAWRFSARHALGPNPERLIEGVEPRLNQTALSLLSLVDDPALRSRIQDMLLGENDARRNERGESEEGLVLAALLATFDEEPASNIRVADVAGRLAEVAPDQFHLPQANRRVGWVLRNRLRVIPRKSNGVYVIPLRERARILALAARYGLRAAAVSTMGTTARDEAHDSPSATDQPDAKS